MSSSTADQNQGPQIEVFELDDGDPDPWGAAESMTPPRPTPADGVRPAPVAVPVPVPAASQSPALAAELRALAGAAGAGVAAVASILVVAFAGLDVLVHASMSRVTLGFHAFYTWAAWIAGSALDTPVRANQAIQLDPDALPTDSQLGTFEYSYDIRITVLLLTGLGFATCFLLARRMERGSASADLWRLAVRALMSGVFAALAVLLLAETSHSRQLLSPNASVTLGPIQVGPSASPSDSAGLAAMYAFLGPLLIVFAAALLGRLSVWIRVPGLGARDEYLRTRLVCWARAGRVVWLQSRLVGLVSGISLLIYVLDELDKTSRFSAHMAPVVLGGILLLGNIAVLGAFGGFGATLFAGMSLTMFNTDVAPGADFVQSTSPRKSYFDTGTQSIYFHRTDYGLFGEHRPVIVWLLLGGVVLALALLVGLSRGRWWWTRRFVVPAEQVPMSGVWRAAALGGAGAFAAVFVGRLTTTVSTLMPGMDVHPAVTFTAGPRLLAPIGLSALWCAIGYALVSRAASAAAGESAG